MFYWTGINQKTISVLDLNKLSSGKRRWKLKIKLELDIPDQKYEKVEKIAKLKKKQIKELLLDEIDKLIIHIVDQLNSIGLTL